jgi:hypothetical protein
MLMASISDGEEEVDEHEARASMPTGPSVIADHLSIFAFIVLSAFLRCWRPGFVSIQLIQFKRIKCGVHRRHCGNGRWSLIPVTPEFTNN